MEKFFKDSCAEKVLEAEVLAPGFAKWLHLSFQGGQGAEGVVLSFEHYQLNYQDDDT